MAESEVQQLVLTVPCFGLACRASRGDLAGGWLNPPQRPFSRRIAKKIKDGHSILLTGIVAIRSIADSPSPEQHWVINCVAVSRGASTSLQTCLPFRLMRCPPATRWEDTSRIWTRICSGYELARVIGRERSSLASTCSPDQLLICPKAWTDFDALH